jgi:PAS domain S-box-containing protein
MKTALCRPLKMGIRSSTSGICRILDHRNSVGETCVPEKLQTAGSAEGLCESSAEASIEREPGISRADGAVCEAGWALNESEERFHLLVDAVTDYAIYMLDPEGRVMTWNQGAKRSKGYAAEEVLGRNFSVFFLPEDVEAGTPAKELAAAAREGRYAVDGWRLRKNGEKFWAQVTLTAIRGEQGELRGFAKVTRDMSAQKAADEALQSRNGELERYRIIVENLGEYGIGMLDENGCYTNWGGAGEKLIGYRAGEVPGQKYDILATEEDRLAGWPQKELEEAARTGRSVRDCWKRRRDGSLFWASCVLTSVRDETGKLTGYVRVGRDMTQHKRAEDELHRLNAQLQRYRTMIENIDVYAIYTLDLEGRITSWEAGAQKMTGTTPEQMLGRHHSMFFAPEEALAGLPEHDLQEAARTGRYVIDAWRITPAGERVWSSGVINALRDETGKLTGYVRMARILTSQKEAEDALRALNAQLNRFRVIVENITDHVIFTLDAEGRIDSWGPGAQNMLGYTMEEALGREYSMIFAREEIEAGKPQGELNEAAGKGHCSTADWRVRKSGERYWSSGETTAIRDDAGRVAGYVRVARDTTIQKRMEESLEQLAFDLEDRVAERTRQLEDTVVELLKKNAEVERMAQDTARNLEEKRLMLNEIHHRVKNNLQVVQSLLKMSVRSLPEGDARSVTMATAQRVYAMAMIHERLYQTRDLAGVSVSTYLRDIFAGVTDLYPSLRGQIKLVLESDDILLGLDQGIPFGLMVNELLSNSLKHGFPAGRKGTVTVSIHRMQGAVSVAVEDDGVGLPEDFDAAKCTSMGLKLADSLAHQLGGRLTFTSSRGCRVQTDLPRLEVAPPGKA